MSDRHDDRAALADVLAEEARAAAQRFDAGSEHPDAEQLVAYHQGALDEAAAAAVRAHAVACPTCAGLLLDLEAPFAPEAGDAGVADFEQAAVWKAVRAEIAGETAGLATGPSARSEAAAGTVMRSPLLPWLVAATLLVAAGALALRVRQLGGAVRELETTVASLEAPQGGVPILYLDGVTRGELDGGDALEVPADATIFVAILTPSEPERFTRYRVAVDDDAGSTVVAVDDLALNEHGTVRVALSRRGLPPGRYTVRLLGVAEDGAAEALDRYVIRILDASGS